MPETREEFLARNPHLSEFLPFLDNLNAESPRGRALIAGGYLEELLKRVLLGFMRDVKEAEELVDGSNAPLATFSARTQACFALGLIEDNEYQELVLIRRIRNEVAHNAKASFDDPAIASRCRELKYRAPGNSNPVGQFTSAAVALISALVNRAHYVR
jgi:mannitol operon repressor